MEFFLDILTLIKLLNLVEQRICKKATVIPNINLYNNFKKFLLETRSFNAKEAYVDVLKIHTDGSVYFYMLSNDIFKDYTMFNINDEGSLQYLLENYYNNQYVFIAKPFIGNNRDNRARIRDLKRNYRNK